MRNFIFLHYKNSTIFIKTFNMQTKIFFSGITVFVLLWLKVTGQESIGAIKGRYNNSENDSSRIVALLDMAYYYLYRDNDSTLYYCDKATALARKNNNPVEISNARNIRAMAFNNKGDYVSSLTELEQAVATVEVLKERNPGDPFFKRRLLSYYNTTGNTYYFMSDFASAIDYYLKSIKLAEELKYPSLPILYANVGAVYKEWGEFGLSVRYMKKAMEKSLADNNQETYLSALVNLGAVFYDNDVFDSALYYYRIALPYVEKKDNPDVLIAVYLNLGMIYNIFGKLNKANRYLEKAKKIIDENEFLRSKIYYYKGKAQLSEKLGDNEKSCKYLLKAYFLSDSLGELKNSIDIIGQLCNNYTMSGDYKNAYNFLVIKEKLKDSIFNEKNAETIKELQIKFDVEKKNMEIKNLKIIQKKDKKMKMLLISGIILVFITSLLLLYVFYEKRKRSEIEKELVKTENEKNLEKMQFQNRQLASQALTMMQKNKMLYELQKNISEIEKEIPENIAKKLNRIKFQIKRSINSEKEWEVFKLYFEQVNKTFFKKLKEINQELTNHDLKIAALIKLKLNIKESASILNLSPHSIKGTRYRLRKKLGLSSKESLTDFIDSID